MSTEDTSKDQTRPDEVADFLKSEGVILEGISEENTLHLPEETEVPAADTPRNENFDEDKPTQTAASTWAFIRKPGKLPEVTVSDIEKDLFLKAAVTDFRFELGIPVASGIMVTCVSLTDWEQQTLFSALAGDVRAGKLVTDEDYYSRLQSYCIILQVRTVHNTPFKHFVQLQETMSDTTAVTFLQEAHARTSRVISTAYRELCLKALYTFHVKMKILTDNLVNENFWSPAAAA